MLYESRLVKLGPAGCNGKGKSDPHAPTQVPDHVVKGCGLSHLFFWYVGQGQGGGGYKDACHGDPQRYPWYHEGPEIGLQVEK